MIIYIGIIVLALAIIAIVIWVAQLSNRIKRLSDRIMLDTGTQRPAQSNYTSPSQYSTPTPVPRAAQPYQQQTQQFQPQPMAQGQPVRPIQPAVNRMRTNAVQPMQQDDGGQAFFDSYRDRDASQQTGAFGRERPSIPFGADQNERDRRESYTRDAVNEDYDPDSIDFSRVAGYRNIRR